MIPYAGYAIAFCAFVLIIVQAVQLVYIPGSVANPNASKYENITISDIGVSVGMGACTIVLLLIIMGLGIKA